MSIQLTALALRFMESEKLLQPSSGDLPLSKAQKRLLTFQALVLKKGWRRRLRDWAS